MGSDKRISLISSHLAHAVVTYSLIFLIGLQCVGDYGKFNALMWPNLSQGDAKWKGPRDSCVRLLNGGKWHGRTRGTAD